MAQQDIVIGAANQGPAAPMLEANPPKALT